MSTVRRVLCLLLVFLGGALAAGADEAPHPLLRGFLPTGEFDLYIARELRTSRIFFAQKPATYLVVPEDTPDAFLLQQRSRVVSRLPASAVVVAEDGSVDLPASVQVEDLGPFQLVGLDVVVDLPALKARLKPRPDLLGRHSYTDVLAHSPQYGPRLRGYALDEAAVGRLRAVQGNPRVDVIFGSWCPRCQQQLPRALRVAAALEGAGIRFVFCGIPAPPEGWKAPLFVESGAKALPTAVVYVGDQAKGRLGPDDWSQLEVALLRLLGA